MIIEFKVKRATAPGEKVFITGSSPLIGSYEVDKALELEQADQTWTLRLKVDPFKERIFSYKYFAKSADGRLEFEAGGGRRLALNSNTQYITTLDEWQQNNEESPFLTDPFAYVFYGATYSPYTQTHRRLNELIIRAVVPNMPNDCNLVLIGNISELGNWHVSKGLKMARLKGLKWIASIDAGKLGGKELEYAFAMVSQTTGEVVYEGERIAEKKNAEPEKKYSITVPELSKHQTLIVEQSNVRFNTPIPRFAGVSVPLAALRSEKSCGIGEIADLKLLVDWASATGMKVINILPINDTTRYFNSKDSSPYNCISSIALNPIYLSIDSLPELKDKRKAKEAQEERRSLNRRASIDYEDVYAFKLKYFREVYTENEEELTSHPNYYKFIKANKEWLYSYALFCSLRDYYKTANFSLWGPFAKYSQILVDQISTEIYNYSLNQTWGVDLKPVHASVRYYVYLQFLLYNQMKEVIDYAHSKGIALAGELPMNVSPESVDAWKMPYLFNFSGDSSKDKKENLAKIQSIVRSSQTGAAAPVYNWKAMEEEKYLWWIMRVRAIHSIYDIISLGRIGQQAGMTDNHEIVKLLPQLVSASNMLVCGKFTSALDAANTSSPDLFSATRSFMLIPETDLVMKSESIRKCLDSMHILSMELPDTMKSAEVLQESRDGGVNPAYYSVAATSTCNSRTLRMWLGERIKTISYTSEDDGVTYYDATPGECARVVRNVLCSGSMLALIPLSDWMSLDGRLRNRFPYSERVNNPDVNGWVWKFRMHITLEQLLSSTSLTAQIHDMIVSSGRE